MLCEIQSIIHSVDQGYTLIWGFPKIEFGKGRKEGKKRKEEREREGGEGRYTYKNFLLGFMRFTKMVLRMKNTRKFSDPRKFSHIC